MSDPEFLLLSREIGHVEAHRRRLIRATLARGRAESQARGDADADTDIDIDDTDSS